MHIIHNTHNSRLQNRINQLRVKAVEQLTYYQFRIYNESQILNAVHLDEISFNELTLITENRYVLELVEEINELKREVA